MTNINSDVAFNTLKALKKIYKKKTPLMNSVNFNLMPISVVSNRLLRYDSTQLVAQVTGNDGNILISREQNVNVRTILRFLPWGQNCCTGFELDQNARVVFSGPFSGCCFFIAQDPHSGSPVFLHSNDNTNQGAMNRPATLATQRANADQYLTVYHNGTSPLYHCGYEQMGMVPSWILAVDVHGSQREWDVYCVNLLPGRSEAVRKVGGCLIV